MANEVQDLSLQGNCALPNAANTVNTNVVDLGANPYPAATKAIEVRVSTTQSTGANSKNINFALQHSNESNANFANIAELAIQTIAGNAANYPATNANFALPASTKRYIRATALGEANGGNASDGTITVKVLL
jgi:hypothetical protein